MILTDKAKEDFLKWFDNEYMELACEYDGCFNMPITSLNALIIEWLDSVNIFIQVNRISWPTSYTGFQYSIHDMFCNGKSEKTRSEATQKAIEKANEIYNNLNTKENEK